MQHSYIISGMTCGHCVKRVQTVLSEVNGIDSVSVTLEPPRATLVLHKHVELEHLNHQLSKAGVYSLKMDHSDMD